MFFEILIYFFYFRNNLGNLDSESRSNLISFTLAFVLTTHLFYKFIMLFNLQIFVFNLMVYLVAFGDITW